MVTIMSIYEAVIGVCLVYPMDRPRAFAESQRMCAERFNYTLTYEAFLPRWKESKGLR